MSGAHLAGGGAGRMERRRVCPTAGLFLCLLVAGAECFTTPGNTAILRRSLVEQRVGKCGAAAGATPAAAGARLWRPLTPALAMSSDRVVVLSTGKGDSGVLLGTFIVDALKAQGIKVTPLEPMLRHSVMANAECSLDDFYGGAQVQQGSDGRFLATHEASGMQVSMGCPVHILYGIKGGCEACKCRVPTMDEVKRFCPYFGPGGSERASRTAWELREEIGVAMQKASNLIIVSAGEDVSAAPDNPRRQSILKYQSDLVEIAKESGVGNVLVVGPSDPLPMGVTAQMRSQMMDHEVISGLEGSARQFEAISGVDVTLDDAARFEDGGNRASSISPLLIEAVLKEQSMPHKIIRAPCNILSTPAVAEVVVHDLMYSGKGGAVFIKPIKGYKEGEGI